MRGAHINVDEDVILELRPVTRVPRPNYLPRKDVILDVVGVELTGLLTLAWGGRRFLKQGEVTDKYKMLNLIVVSNFASIG